MTEHDAREQEAGNAASSEPIAGPEPSGDDLPDEAAAELAAVAEAEHDGLITLRGELQEARDALDAERAARRAAVARYRAALLTAEPALPPELVEGDDTEAVDASVEAARRTVAEIRERIARESEDEAARGFPAGAPERRGPRTEAMTTAEKIAYGLEQRSRT